MYVKVVLADDEKGLLLMRKLIDWEGLGFELSAWRATV